METLTSCRSCGNRAQVFCACTSLPTLNCFPLSLEPTRLILTLLKKLASKTTIQHPEFQPVTVSKNSLSFLTNTSRKRVNLEENCQVSSSICDRRGDENRNKDGKRGNLSQNRDIMLWGNGKEVKVPQSGTS